MPVIYEEFIRCEECSNPDFKKEERLTFHKKVKARNSIQDELEYLEKEIYYVCTKCGHELNK